MQHETCFGCRHLLAIADAAGGGIYKCAKSPGLVIGSWGIWTDQGDIPRPLDACYEDTAKGEQK
jgi:hypothetical protein